ncbi:MAG TPA: phytanoyl-CoA dioxygenase family protein [Chthonomonadaceae bacterium]|nr:phytanoyl-CoA dioxygenase family protein [Chthonomonadaceae bacterium]
MDIKEALYELGVREDTLSQEEKDQLDRDGYLPLRGLLTMEQVEAIRRRQEELLAEEGDQAGLEVYQERGTDRLADLINKGTCYHVVITHPRLLAAVAHVLKWDLKLSSLNSRAALPGQGQQGLHPDWGRLEVPGDYQVCNSVWLLDDFTPENGATRVVPGSHCSGKLPGDEMADPSLPHPNEVLLLGKAGDVVVFNAHCWHGGTLNRTDKPRRAMHGYFTRRHQPQQLDQQKYLRRETWEQLSPAARVVLGVEKPADW